MPKLGMYWGIVGAAPKNANRATLDAVYTGLGKFVNGRIFYLCNPLHGTVQILSQIVVLFYTSPYFWPGQKLFRGSPCKRKGDPFKFLAVVRTHPCKQDLDNPGITGNRLKVNAPELLRETLQLRCIPVNHNYNKILKYDWLSSVLISALKGLCNRSVRVMPK